MSMFIVRLSPVVFSAISVKVTRWGTLVVDEKYRATLKGVFAGGNAVRGESPVVLAMGDGKRAAEAIDEYIKTGEWPKEIKPQNF